MLRKADLKEIAVAGIALRNDIDGLETKALSVFIDCPIDHVDDLVSGKVKPTAREAALAQVLNCAPLRKLLPAIRSAISGHDWQPIPGYSKYEVSEFGSVRRAKAGHGSLVGKVLRPKVVKSGHLYLKLSDDDGNIKSIGVHTVVCLAFNGPRPSNWHIVCHRNDVVTDNTRTNVYWGTHRANAIDRETNRRARESGTLLTRWPHVYGPPTLSDLRKHTKKTMDYRKEMLAAKA